MATAIRAIDGEWIEPVIVEPVEPAAVVYPTEFLTWLENEEERAKDEKLNDQRAVAIRFYNGEPFGDEVRGRSQIVTRDVAEVIDYTVPSVLRTMVSGDRIVEFEALDSGFKDVLEEATEAVSQQFMQEQSGWRILHDSLKSGLLEKTGAIKCYVEEERERREQDVTATQLAQLTANGIEIAESEPIGQWAAMSEGERALIEQTEVPEAIDQLGPIFRVAWFETRPKFVDTPMPNEEFGVAPDARSLEEAIYYNHRTTKTFSELRSMGLNVDLLESQYGGYNESNLSKARDLPGKEAQPHREGPNRCLDFLEEYCRYDLNGDGLAEFLRVQRVGRVILRVDEIDYGPCEEWCPFPMPHRRVGQSLADKVMDIQRTRSVLMRQAMDNLYQSNIPRMLVPENSIGLTTVDDLLTFDFGALIRYKGGEAPKPLAVPFVAGHAFQAMEILTGERESRTGITRLNQGLDADALNKTATGTALMQAQGQQIEEYIARNFAEFVGRVFLKKYRLMKDFGKPFQIIVDGEPRTVDPRGWPDDLRVVVRVGLGSGRKEQRIQHRMLLLNLQKEAAQSGDPHVTGKEIFNSVKGIVADLGLGQPTDYYSDPDKMPEQPNTPDPEMAKAQAQVQIENAKIQAKMQADAANHQAEMVKAQAKHQLEQTTAMANMQLEQAKARAAAQLDRERAEFEARLASERASFEQRLAVFKTQLEQQKGVDVPENRRGGDLSE